MFTAIKTPLTFENVLQLVNANKIYLQNGHPVGDADHIVLSYAPSYKARQATPEDLPLLMYNLGIDVYITPVLTPESTFTEGIHA